MRTFRLMLFGLLISSAGMFGQSKHDLVYVDSLGTMRWTATGVPAYFFGVNYASPFAFSYRALKAKGISIQETIDADVRQFKRLGINAFRIHVWDREVSDSSGNLLENEHLKLLDYLIQKLIENKIYVILTPVAWWGNGWPEPDYPTPGFSSNFSKIQSSTVPRALEVQKNYIAQFLNHRNTFTGKKYCEQKEIIAYELYNEPNLPDDSTQVSNYVNSLRQTAIDQGITCPIFFNISENPFPSAWKGVAGSKVDGVSFQWYPTGLVKLNELAGNMLPHVLSYPLPEFAGDVAKKAKMIYEFDAADVDNPIMYPVMANSFRKAGMQWATMFCYDPAPLAAYNAEYPTHYLNALYTPQKAVALAIAAELFTAPKTSDKVVAKGVISMDDVTVSYPEKLSILNNGEKFYYTASTTTKPVNEKRLSRVLGCGSSSVVAYSGSGWYAAEKLEEGKWRLELFPDIVPIKDAYGKNTLQDPVRFLLNAAHLLQIRLPGLQSGFSCTGLTGVKATRNADGFSIMLSPGSYILANAKPAYTDTTGCDYEFNWLTKNCEWLKTFNETVLRNLTPEQAVEGSNVILQAQVFCVDSAAEVLVFAKKASWSGYQKLSMSASGNFTYRVKLPDYLSSNGLIQYYYVVKSTDAVLTFPGRKSVAPDHWGFYDENSYTLQIGPKQNRIMLYSPVRDKQHVIAANIWRYAEYSEDITFDENQSPELAVIQRKVKHEFPEYALQISVGKYLPEFYDTRTGRIEVLFRNTDSSDTELELRCIFSDGTAKVQKVTTSGSYNSALVSLAQSNTGRYALLPRPYPIFLPYWFDPSVLGAVSEDVKLETIQIGIPLTRQDGKPFSGIKIKSIEYLK